MPKNRNSSRQSRPAQALRIRRSRRSRVAGWGLVVVGVVIAALTYTVGVVGVTWLSAGPEELYVGLGVLLVSVGLWLTGLGDAR